MPSPATTALARTPQAAELFRRRAQLAVLRAELAARESTLAHLRNQLHSFEGRYIRQVGVLYRQLDEWEARIAELEVAHESIEQTERLLREARLATPQTPPPESTPAPQILTLKFLFREVAKRIHPDFALNPADALRRTHLMAQANDALRRADAALLYRMIHTHDLPHRTLTTAEALAETLTLLAQTQTDLTALDAEIATLAQSEMASLRDRTQLAALRGRDLLAELAAQVKGRIGLAMRRYELDLARIRRNQPAFNPEFLLSAEIRNP